VQVRSQNSTTWGRTPLPLLAPLPQLISFKLAWIVRSNEFIFHPFSLSFASGRISFQMHVTFHILVSLVISLGEILANMPILDNMTNSMRYICFAQQNVKIYGDIQL